jgi:PleD family two-component response regulator
LEEKPALLIVEDDVDVAEMVTTFFRGQGYEVFTVNWGEEAIEACRTNHPDLVVLDIRLPDIDGFEVARRLRKTQRTQNIPIIFLTERREQNDRMQGLELGADDYVTKPFDIQELRLRVRNALHRLTPSSLTNPVTGLPEGILVDERLQECLSAGDWGLLVVAIDNFGEFRESYGFVTSDDVQRAIGLIIHNAIRDLGGSSDFIGQMGPTEFVLVTRPTKILPLTQRIGSRLDQSLDYFYPLKDRSAQAPLGERLGVRMGHLVASDGPFKNLDDLKMKLAHQLA